MLRRTVGSAVSVVVLMMWTAGTAYASLWLEMAPTEAAPGTEVVGQTIGEGAAPDAAGQNIPAFLVPSGSDVGGPADDLAEPIGAVEVDENGTGTLRFAVPNVAPGNYDVYVDCHQCSPPGFIPAGEFRVLQAPAEAGTSPWLLVGAAAAGIVVLGAGALVVARRRDQRFDDSSRRR